MSKLLLKKNILISGIGKGLGLDMYYKCIDHGAFVYGFADPEKMFKNKQKYLRNSKIFIGDCTNENFIKKLFLYFKKKKIILNALINNVGQRQRKSFRYIKKRNLQDYECKFFINFLITQNL